MVSPKLKTCPEKVEESTSTSVRFQEPEGMTTIDLSKSNYLHGNKFLFLVKITLHRPIYNTKTYAIIRQVLIINF